MEDAVKKQSRADKPWLFPKGVSGNAKGRKKMTMEEKMIKRAAKQKINAYLENQGIGAASRIVKISRTAKNENVMLSANQDILDRIGVTQQKPGMIVPIQINFNDNDLQ